MGDLVLKWDKPHEENGKHMKFQPLWIRPFTIEEKLRHNTFKLKLLDVRIDLLPVNGPALKHYIQYQLQDALHVRLFCFLSFCFLLVINVLC